MSLNFPDTTVNNPDTGAPWAQGDTVEIGDVYTFNTDAGLGHFWWSGAPGGPMVAINGKAGDTMSGGPSADRRNIANNTAWDGAGTGNLGLSC